jgi:hypothetical protein
VVSDGAARFSPDYFTARDRFLRAAASLTSNIQSIAMSSTGPRGEPLTIDVATLEAGRSDRVVIVSSGLHGVEGFAGSAVQLAWLEHARRTNPRPPIRVVVAHGLNPYGFAWLRRANERNVDLNRNFTSDRSFLDTEHYRRSSAVYARFSGFLNPPSPPSRREPYTALAALRVLLGGRKALESALPAGQYEHERGLFFGGHELEETTRVLRREIEVWTRGAHLAVHLDVHTGLGRWADRQLLIADAPASSRGQWVHRAFGEGVRAADPRVAYRAHGTMAEDFRDRLLPCEYHGITAEFGTYSGLRVLGALRAENRAHFHAEPASDAYTWAKDQILEAFAPASPAWRRTVVTSGVSLIDRAIAVSSV